MDHLEPRQALALPKQHPVGALLVAWNITRIYNMRHGFEGELEDRHQRNSLAGSRVEVPPWEQC